MEHLVVQYPAIKTSFCQGPLTAIFACAGVPRTERNLIKFTWVQELNVDRFLRPSTCSFAEAIRTNEYAAIGAHVFHHPLELFDIFNVKRSGMHFGVDYDTLRAIITKSAINERVDLPFDAAQMADKLHVRIHG